MQGHLRHNESLARYTSWRVGGQARQLYHPANQADLLEFLASLPVTEPLLWLGYGSNLLIRDGGFPGTVILLRGTMGTIEKISADNIRAGAGTGCAKLAHFAVNAGLAGAEFLAGIPGTVGGALALNAGAHGGEIWNLVREVVTTDRFGTVNKRSPNEYHIGYRDVSGPDNEWFLEATFALNPNSAIEAMQERMRNYLKQRAKTQPIGLPSAGSTFRNPPGDSAGRLIEAAGLKGLRYGGAEISTKHANFIINTGTATSKDIEILMERIQRDVAERFGIQLVPEVKIVGLISVNE